ncbi:MAG: Zn-dependent protease [Halobacteriovoraceae bacterium]|nr:Zn-dependent protease [Halobacteriovoraceae bacterium]|tara:strand:- start:8066 stop:9400 length:1335 start_codon:yes stop_codon:yes gene_type:complete
MDHLLKAKMQKLIDMSLAAGADKADVILSAGDSFSLSAQNNKIDKYQVSGSQVLGLRVIKDQKIGLAYSEALDEDALKSISEAAVENAKNSEVNPHEDIRLENGEKTFESEYKQVDTDVDEKINFCLSLEADVLKKEPKAKAAPYNGLGEGTSSSYYMNHLGTFTYESDYYMSCYTSALIQDGANSSMHFHDSMGRKLSDLKKDECVNESIEHAKEWLTAKSLSTGKYDVIFTPDAFSQVFGCFSNIYSAKGAMEKTNPFADRLGQKVMSELITIKDIPQYQDGFFKSFVDSEGVLQEDLDLVVDGVMKNFYHNSSTAHYFNTETNGRAARGAKSSLGTSGTTKVISAGKTNVTDLKSGEYFKIHSLQGLHSGANAISGEFSFAASGYLMKDGKRVRPVKGVTVSSNFHKMLTSINLIGDKIESTTNKGFFSPLMRFENISIAG